jgi:hypothetical protein
MVCILVCIHSNMGCNFYFILPNTGIKLHMSMTACKWMLHLYCMEKKNSHFFQSLNWMIWACNATTTQSHIPYHNTSLCNWTHHSYHSSVWELFLVSAERGGVPLDFWCFVVEIILISSSSAVNKFSWLQQTYYSLTHKWPKENSQIACMHVHKRFGVIYILVIQLQLIPSF